MADTSLRAALDEARIAALTPSSGGVLGRWVGKLASFLMLREVPVPAPEGKEFLQVGLATDRRGGVAAVADAAGSLVHTLDTVSASVTGQTASAQLQSARDGAVSALQRAAGSVRSGIEDAVTSSLPQDFSKEAGEFISRARTALPPPGENVSATMDILDQAEKAWCAGDLHRTIALLQQLRGLPAAAVHSWLAAASTRALAEQAVSVSTAYATSVAGSLY